MRPDDVNNFLPFWKENIEPPKNKLELQEVILSLSIPVIVEQREYKLPVTAKVSWAHEIPGYVFDIVHSKETPYPIDLVFSDDIYNQVIRQIRVNLCNFTFRGLQSETAIQRISRQ